FVTVDLFAEPLLVYRSRDRDYRVWMQMIYVSVGDKRVQGRVYRARPRVEIERAVRVQRIHLVFDLSFWSARGTREIDRFHRANLVDVERAKAVAPRGPQVSA